jgi:hypothetical protein
MTLYQDLFNIGEAFETFVGRGLPAEINTVRRIQQQLADTDALSPATLERLRAVRGRFHLLAAGEMWCPDCQINLTALDQLQRVQPNIALAVITKSRAEHALKTPLALERISIPFVLVLDEAFQVLGRFVESPQAVVDGGDAVKPDYRAGKFLENTVLDVLAILDSGHIPAV